MSTHTALLIINLQIPRVKCRKKFKSFYRSIARDSCWLHIWKKSNRHVVSSKVNVNICMQKRSQVWGFVVVVGFGCFLCFFFKMRTVYKKFTVSGESLHLYKEIHNHNCAIQINKLDSIEDWISGDMRNTERLLPTF